MDIPDRDEHSERNHDGKETEERTNNETESAKQTKETGDVEKMDELETPLERSQRMWSIRIVHFTMFLMTLGFSIVLTGVYPYLDKLDPSAGKEFMGYVVAANPLGQMLFSPLIGWWSTRIGSIRSPLFWTIILFTISSGWYSILEIFEMSHRRYWMLVTRLLVGISSANVVVARSYISDATTIQERTREMSWLSLAQVLGFVFGPVLQMAVTPLGEIGVNMGLPGLTMDMYTAAGWLNVPLGLINLILLHPKYFVERKIAVKEAMVAQGYSTERETWKAWKPDYLAAWTLVISFFIFTFNFVLLETLGTLLTMEQFAWTKEEAITYMGIIMTVGAIIAFAVFGVIKWLCEKFEERWVLIVGGFGLMVLGRFCHIPWADDTAPIGRMVNGTMELGCPETQEWCLYTPGMTLTQFIVGYMFTSAGYPLGITLIQSIFSKGLGPRPQGVWMGLMTGSGCLSRVLGPVFVSVIYTELGTIWTFGVTAAMMTFFTVWMIIFRNRFIVPESALEKALKLKKQQRESNGNTPANDEQAVKLLNDNGIHKVKIIPTNHQRDDKTKERSNGDANK